MSLLYRCYTLLCGDKIIRYIDKRKLIFARWLMLSAVNIILKVSSRAGNGSMMVRKFITHEIDVFLEYRAYKQQGYRVKIK